MNINDVEDSLPYGFHDSWIRSISVDYLKRVVKFAIEVWVDYEDPIPGVPGRKPVLREGELVVTGLHALILPAPKRSYGDDGELDAIGNAGAAEDVQLPPLPTGAFVYSFWIGNWVGSIVFAAQDAEFRWVGPEP